MFIRNWSPAKKANAAIFGALALALMVYALRDSSPEPKTVLSKPAVPTLTAVSPAVGLSTEALVHPRTWIAVRVAASGPTARQDDHWGECPAFSHLHQLMGVGSSTGGDAEPDPPVTMFWGNVPVVMDGLCHDDKSDEPIKERPTLPKPKFNPNKKAVWA